MVLSKVLAKYAVPPIALSQTLQKYLQWTRLSTEGGFLIVHSRHNHYNYLG